MKYFFFTLCFFTCLHTYAQSPGDTLLHRPFNETWTALEKIFLSYEDKQDSAGLFKKMDEITVTAVREKDTELALLSEYMKVRHYHHIRTKDTKRMDAGYMGIVKKALRQENYKIASLAEFNLAAYYWGDIQNYELAFEHFLETYRHLQHVKDDEFFPKRSYIYTLGEKYYFFTDYVNSIYYLHKALEVESPKDREGLISIYNTMGMAYAAKGDLDSAEHYYLLGLQVADELDSRGWTGNLSGNLGNVYLKRGELDKALEWLRADVRISLESGSYSSAAGALMSLSALNFKAGNPKLAIAELDTVMEIMHDWSLHRLKTFYPLMSKRYAYEGNWKQASAYLDSSLAVRDSIAVRSSAIQLLRAQQRTDLEEHRAELNKVEQDKKIKTLQRNVTTGVLLLALFGGVLLFRQKRKTDKARKRSDELLLNILPSNIAAELKANGESKARRFSEVTVLFSDFKDFTQHSETLNPEELVRILDTYFKAFDRIIGQYGLEKIKTVGDAYICACGLPDANPVHAEKVVKAAIEMQQFMKGQPDGWQLRIGIHSGPVVAGIVGIKKFAYDIWGDTVNTAARMEQNSEAGQINISQVTYELVKDKFTCEHRGKIEAKNKGAMDMYFVRN